MSVIVCDCSTGNSNTGKPDCTTAPGVGKKDFFIPLKDSAGNKNRINLDTDVLDDTYFEDWINEVDASQRLFPFPEMDTLIDLRDDPTLKTLSSGNSQFVKEGPRKNSYMIPDCWGAWLGKAQSFNCGSNGFYRSPKGGGLIGKLVVEAGVRYLEPIPVSKKSFYAGQIEATDDDVAMVKIQFEVKDSYNDADSRLIKKSEMADHDLLEDNGLFDLNIVSSLPLTTGVTVTVTTDFGTAPNPEKVKGLLPGDFACAEITPAAGAVAISSAAEGPDGTYLIVYTAPQSSADTQQVTVTKTGFAISTSDIYTTP